MEDCAELSKPLWDIYRNINQNIKQYLHSHPHFSVIHNSKGMEEIQLSHTDE